MPENSKNEIFYGDYEFEPGPLGLGYELFNALQKNRNKIAQILVDTNRKETFGTILEKSIRTALKLQSLGIGQGDIITLSSHNHANTCIPIVASQFIRCQIASLDPSLSLNDSTHLVKQVTPKIIFTSLEGLSLIEQSIKCSQIETKIVVFGKSDKYMEFSEFLKPQTGEENFKPVTSGSNEDTAIIFFSSGTTGFPKGICLSHYCIMAQANQGLITWKTNEDCFVGHHKIKGLGRTGDNLILAYTSFYWISGVMLLARSILAGEARIIASKFVASEWWDHVEQYKATFAFLPPSYASDIVKNCKKDVDTSSLLVFMIGGSSVTETLMKELQDKLPSTSIVQGYGQTEAGGMITTFNTHDLHEMELQRTKPLSCGKPVLGIRYKIVDPETEKTLGPNERGELRFKSKMCMNGYYKQDSSHVYDKDGFMKTGDIAYYDEDDCFYVVDRLKEMFKYKSWHIVPASLENIIHKHPDVKEAVVIGIPHGDEGEHPMGVVVLNETAKATPQELEKFVEDQVLDIQRLRAGVKIVKDLPRTITGKIIRRHVREMVCQKQI